MKALSFTKKISLASVAALSAAVAAQGQDVYVSDNTTPWGYSGIYNDMSAALPATSFETFGAAGTSVFNSANKVILIEGGDGNSTDFDSYFQTPGVIGAAQSWVAAGGSLIINGGRWTFDPLNLGFGLTMLQPDYADASFTGTVVGSPIASGATSPDALWQNIFSYAASGTWDPGTGLTPMILTSASLISLGEENYGLGHVIAGGLTSPEFQGGSGSSYTGNYFSHDVITSVPDAASSATLLSFAMGGLMCLRHRKQ